MSERMLTIAEKRQMKAVIKALIYGMELCEDDEKSLIKRFTIPIPRASATTIFLSA